MVLEELGIEPDRVALEWISAAEAPLFAEKITAFTEKIQALGPLFTSEGLQRRLQAAQIAMAGVKLRTAFARQAKQVKENNTYGELPDPEKLRQSLSGEMTLQEVFLTLQEERRSAAELAGDLDLSEEAVSAALATLQKKKKINADNSIVETP